jgi:acetate kinase
MKILVLNSGSSSQKSSLYEIGDILPEHEPRALWEGKVEWDGGWAKVRLTDSEGATSENRVRIESRRKALEYLFRSLRDGKLSGGAKSSEIDVVGHRIVHGGPTFAKPTLVTLEVKEAIAGVSAFAPLHNRSELEGIELMEQLLGSIPQIAVFDTGFHHNLPLPAAVYPGPYDWLARGIRRYGFHGINHQYCAERAARLLGKESDSINLVSCHLGNGCSLAAIAGGRSVDTTMGFTPLEGVMMGTRSGSVDPGILTYLIREEQMTGQELDELLNEKSGLLGISGVSSDMRQILAAMKSGNERAKLAFEIFVHRLRSGIGSMVAALDGLDALIFTAGIGENSPEVREAVCARLGYLGLELDLGTNQQSQVDQDVAARDSKVRVLVVHAQEEWAIARQCWRMYSKS